VSGTSLGWPGPKSCFQRAPRGGVESDFAHRVCRITRVLILGIQEGSPSVRAVSMICAGSQQAALDSHHAKKKLLPQHNITDDIIVGLSETFILVSPKLKEYQIKYSLKPKWYDMRPEATYVLCKPSFVSSLPKIHILESYNPKVLSLQPVTTRDGIAARDPRWTLVMMSNHYIMMSNHYSMLRSIVQQGDIPFCPIDTVSSCLMAGSFTSLE
jgi:hypothetical protein